MWPHLGARTRLLRLATEKSHGVFVIAESEMSKIDRLFERYGINREDASVSAEVPPPDRLPRVDMGDFGDFREGEGGEIAPDLQRQ
jgi:hypothetical protein